MLKWAALVLLPLALLAVMLLGMVSISVPVPQSEYAYCLKAVNPAHLSKPNCKAAETLWDRGLSDPIAYDTLWLTFFTGVLAAFGLVQGIFLWRADRATAAAFKASQEMTEKQFSLLGLQTDTLIKQKEISRQDFVITHRPRLEVRFVREIGGGIEITVINTGTGSARFVEARAAIWHLLPGERFPSPHDLGPGTTFPLRSTFGPSESDRVRITGSADDFDEGFASPAHIFGWIVYETDAIQPIRRTTYFGRMTVLMEPELVPVDGSDWNFIQ